MPFLHKNIVKDFLSFIRCFFKKLSFPCNLYRIRIVRDVDDDIVIATALAAEAIIIATGDNDLLVLHSWEGIQIFNATDALDYILNKKIKAEK